MADPINIGNDGSGRSPSTVDSSYPGVKLQRVAFGSCHSRGSANKRLSRTNSSTTTADTIWDAIASTVQPQTFLWTGDAIYPPKKTKGDAPLPVMRNEYEQMAHNETLGYGRFLRRGNILAGGVHGTWDDHDYGGNDRGREMSEREERRDEYLDFLEVPKDDARRSREGVYGSVEFWEDVTTGSNDASRVTSNKVKVIFLDTRWHRSKHCIPSVGSNRFLPYGALVACVTRWITAGFDLPSILPNWTSCSDHGELLGEDQWIWLKRQLEESNAAVHVVISSIQVLTTNPVVESWGHFPRERDRLLNILNNVPGLVILSGDVHHAEISSSKPRNNQLIDIGDIECETKSLEAVNKGAIIEVTSSGLTHSCDEPFYGPLCKPILDAFPSHRFKGGNIVGDNMKTFFTGRNFGSINIDWSLRSFVVNVHDDTGNVVLSTGNLEMDAVAGMSHEGICSVAKCIDGHFRDLFRKISPLFYMTGIILLAFYIFYSQSNSLHRNTKNKKLK